jgi:hypothetical protein
LATTFRDFDIIDIFNSASNEATNVRVDRAARINATFAAPINLQNTPPPLWSNELLN